MANPRKKRKTKAKRSTRKGSRRKTARPAYKGLKKRKRKATKRRSTAAKKASAARKRRSRTISFKKTVTVPGGRSKRRRIKVPVRVRVTANPGFTIAGLDMAPVAVGAATAVAINVAFEQVPWLKKIKGYLPEAAKPVAPSLVAILSGILIHEGAKRYGRPGSYWETLGGYVAAAGLVVGISQLLEPQLNKMIKGGMKGAYHDYSGAYHDYSGSLSGAYISTDSDSGLTGAYVDVAPAVSGFGGTGMFGGVSNLA